MDDRVDTAADTQCRDRDLMAAWNTSLNTMQCRDRDLMAAWNTSLNTMHLGPAANVDGRRVKIDSRLHTSADNVTFAAERQPCSNRSIFPDRRAHSSKSAASACGILGERCLVKNMKWKYSLKYSDPCNVEIRVFSFLV